MICIGRVAELADAQDLKGNFSQVCVLATISSDNFFIDGNLSFQTHSTNSYQFVPIEVNFGTNLAQNFR